jgi:hypothetical protein
MHGLCLSDAKLRHSVLFKEVVQRFCDEKVFRPRITPLVAKRFVSGRLALVGGPRDGKKSQPFQAHPGQNEIAVSLHS